MSRSYPAHPLPGVVALVARDGRALMVRRGRPPHQGRWGFPGGLIELGERVLDAAVRELCEETSLTARPGRIVDVFEVIDRDAEGRVRHHFVLHAVTCEDAAGEATAGDDADAVGWFSLADIEAPAFPGTVDVARLARLILA